ncbi:hypothetical protein [Millisia brevis]|uniref:hypothetical protein n=1 Tax=Millisia brevis TaxID=264148 RepID=UPI000A03F1E2|nr:hypothetical protein [Millisia brevis]
MSGDDRPHDSAASPDTVSSSLPTSSAPLSSSATSATDAGPDPAGGSAASEDGVDDRPEPDETALARAAAARRARLDRIFGSVLPDTTGDERGSDARSERDRDDWTRRQRPPHHL